MNNKIENCVILAAGFGVRLKPLTEEEPKCLTEVNGKMILEQTLEILEKNGIKETVIVVGYLGDVIIKKIGHKFRRMKISYLWNKIYDSTNSMYSAWIARKYLEKGSILIEGDTVFEETLMKELLQTPKDLTYWAESRFTEELDGSMAITDSEGRIVELKIIRERLKEYKENYYKSTGVLKITPEYGKLFSKWLDEDVKKGNVSIYYDLVIEKHLKEIPIYVCDITSKAKWFEIDNFDDLRMAENIFKPLRYVIILMDGAVDFPVGKLGGKTPLEVAKKPYIDKLTELGKTGLLQTNYFSLPVCSIVANLGILGYNPLRYYPNGRASFEALAKDIYLDEDDLVFRCNLLSLADKKIKDFTANNISDSDALKIIDNLKIKDEDIEIHTGQSYRNLLIIRNTEINANEIEAFEPHMNIGKFLDKLLLKSHSEKSKKIVNKLNGLMLESIKQIKQLNKKFKTDADIIFLWSPSSTPRLPSFHRKFGIDGAIVTGLDFARGIAIAARMAVKKTKGATGYSDTNLEEKLKDAKMHLMNNELVFIHINAPDEESHNKNVEGKINIIEKIDKKIVGPIIEFLNDKFKDKYRIAILSDHYTLLENGKHGNKSVPYIINGTGILKDNVTKFSEKEIESKSKTVIKSYEFLNFILEQKR